MSQFDIWLGAPRDANLDVNDHAPVQINTESIEASSFDHAVRKYILALSPGFSRHWTRVGTSWFCFGSEVFPDELSAQASMTGKDLT